MPTLLRYLFFQVPGWTLGAVVALVLVRWNVIPSWVAILGFCGLLLKDLAFYPLLRSAYEGPVKTGSEALVGKKGTTQGDLAPEGYVRINLELWRAVADSGTTVIASGTEVEVVAAQGMKLIVRRAR
jgi:membrane protein implicated in regulation of membrane protease activity